MATQQERSLTDDTHQKQVRSALEKALKGAGENIQTLDLDKERWIIFSDQHKGTRDAADDFRECEIAYLAALGYYLELGHHLVVLGDVEELWENRAEPVLKAYQSTLKLEAEFHRRGLYLRFWGNHDDDWSYGGPVRQYLAPLFHGIQVHESLLLNVTQGGDTLGKILLLHGHQGTTFSDRFGWLSKFFVRYGWRNIQRIFKVSLNTPSKSWGLTQRHNIALCKWAVEQEGLVLIAGHTHQPVFDPQIILKRQRQELEHLRSKNASETELAKQRAMVEHAAARESRMGFKMSQPCYFNTGCCCYTDGDVTGLEIADGKIRLVRWPDDEGNPQPKVLAEADLRTEVFSRVAAKGTQVSITT